MLKSGDAVILMQTSFNPDIWKRITFLTGSTQTFEAMKTVSAKAPFADDILDFLDEVSKELMKDRGAKAYSDVITFAFWIRKASTRSLKERFELNDGQHHLGKGVVFHIAPSNVPVNFAYSLATGLLCGNANVVRVPNKDFLQVKILTEAFNRALERYPAIAPYITCVRYERDREINDLFSSVCDMRIIWGGDRTIAELRKSPLPPRSGEITFADRYSLAVIDADSYLSEPNKDKIAEDFYNDTFFSDQNACTSPRLVVWMGHQITEGREVFWNKEHELVKKKYTYQSIQGINKLMTSCMAATALPGVNVCPHEDNLIIRVEVSELTEKLMDYRDNSGFFYEYICSDILDLFRVCNDKHCQTIGYIGKKDLLLPLLQKGVHGVDRIVPIGKTMEFDLIWDGYQLPYMLTRTVVTR